MKTPPTYRGPWTRHLHGPVRGAFTSALAPDIQLSFAAALPAIIACGRTHVASRQQLHFIERHFAPAAVMGSPCRRRHWRRLIRACVAAQHRSPSATPNHANQVLVTAALFLHISFGTDPDVISARDICNDIQCTRPPFAQLLRLARRETQMWVRQRCPYACSKGRTNLKFHCIS